MNTRLSTSLDKLRTNNKVEIFMAGLTVASVIVALLVYYPQVDTEGYMPYIYIFDFIVVIILAIDFCARMKASKQGLRYLVKNWYEIPAMIPLYFFAAIEEEPLVGAALRSFRIIRLFRLLRLLRLTNLLRTAKNLRASGFTYLVIISAIAIIFGAFGIYEVEKSASGTNITDYGNAVWFAVTTITISGFGDVYPVTTEGRVISVVLIFVGLAMILSFISRFGATLIESKLRPKLKQDEESKTFMKNKIDELERLEQKDVETLTTMIKGLHENLQNGSKRSFLCSNCGNTTIYGDIFCSKCGVQLRHE